MPRLRALAALAGAATLIAGSAPAGAMGEAGTDSPPTGGGHLTCVAPSDARAIEALLEAAGSPLAGQGPSLVRHASAVGLDPRALVAIAAHETILATYAPAHEIRNPFGLGPNWRFASYDDSIAKASAVLRDLYLAEGRTSVASIAPKWAPIGAGNDPAGLNRHWTEGVGSYYRALGADPERPILLAQQDPDPCGAGRGGTAAARGASEPVTPGPTVVVAWGGTAPPAPGRRAWEGADPATGEPATLEGFVFPLAAPQGTSVGYANQFTQPGTPGCHGHAWRCTIDLDAGTGRIVVASIGGTLRVADPAEQEAGIGFWIESGRDRFGYGPLARYSPGLAGGAVVSSGQPIGYDAGAVRVAWTRDGVRVNPFPLLAATRPPPPPPEPADAVPPPSSDEAQEGRVG
jgi:hypothetical protein